MNSTPTPEAIEPHDALIARADERLAHAYEQIARADEQLARVTEQLAKMERDAAPHLRPNLARNHRLEGRRSGPSSAFRWRRASLSLPWFYSHPMAAGPS